MIFFKRAAKRSKRQNQSQFSPTGCADSPDKETSRLTRNQRFRLAGRLNEGAEIKGKDKGKSRAKKKLPHNKKNSVVFDLKEGRSIKAINREKVP
ncbi:MAG: hypothetical protein Q4D58_09475 [Synergistaceae bacterium]|nr:hypothetical protein [Synergistaceae bacterium]